MQALFKKNFIFIFSLFLGESTMVFSTLWSALGMSAGSCDHSGDYYNTCGIKTGLMYGIIESCRLMSAEKNRDSRPKGGERNGNI
jgi:hypothetical protein